MKANERIEARRLRRQDGMSMRKIASQLGVSKSSVSLWVRDIELSSAQRARLDDTSLARERRGETFRARRRMAQEEGRAAAREGDPLHAAGCMLYWAEGAKHRNTARLTNSDPDLMRLFVRFLRAYFDVQDDDLRVACNLFADHVAQQHTIEQFWLDVLDLPRTSLCRSTVNVYSKYSKKKRLNRLPYGTCRVSLSSTDVVQHIHGAIQEYGGFERPEWLD